MSIEEINNQDAAPFPNDLGRLTSTLEYTNLENYIFAIHGLTCYKVGVSRPNAQSASISMNRGSISWLDF